ncbi:MAG: ShlB/FhaC/HecB family hemolysin secretion/activation protein [Sulfurimonas sp.]|uniref:ShlB/FhaC/HecB family hemolysin secretion/activation protein n=1 Tax=Sulfurimonas sp. TaxID=2022749 RepID=UPI00260ED2BC|nr:ShlB/FhaC/HecB family hemolysin secretion/activation protein [Sulfurimonas sp.]MDD2651905.1 ShlB/FhaC/HecB family hemolysin secretion/activation protein [Sulfurimonas sp.]MDD3451778.1 ShlB/FhaC/HecB family hemolysin secretion/activation protein [Sulfurimonas sp.]
MKLVLLLLFCTHTLLALTQDEINSLYQQNSLQNRVLENDQKRHFEKNQQKTKDYIDKIKPDKLEMKESEDKKKCIFINDIMIDKSDILEAKELEEIKKHYVNKCNTIEDLNNFTKEISNIYISRGFITSRAYLKLQDLSDGIIDISLLEGKIKKVKNRDLYISNIYDDLEENILNLQDLETGIKQLERLRSQVVKLDLKPSDEVGYTDVLISKETGYSDYNGYVSVNNYGSSATGKNQVAVYLSYENLFGINDIISVSINTTDNVFKTSDNILATSLSYSLPYFKNYFTISLSTFKYKQTIYDQFDSTLLSEGSSDIFTLSDEYMLYNSKKYSLNFIAKLNRKDNKNYLSDTLIELQSYNLTTFSFGFYYIYYGEDSYFSSELLVHKSLSSNIDFTKYTLDFSYTKYFQHDLQPKINMALHAQSTGYDVYATEQLSIGGPYSVRGFKDGGINGFKGGYIRNDFQVTKNILNISFSPYLGLDYGYIKATSVVEGGAIIGSSVGLKIAYLNNLAEIHYNKKLHNTPETKIKSDNFIGFSYSYNF